MKIFEHFSILLYAAALIYVSIALSKLSRKKSTHESAIFRLILLFTVMLGTGAATLYTEVNIATPPLLRRLFVAVILTSLFAIKRTLHPFFASLPLSQKMKNTDLIIGFTTLILLFSQSEKIALAALTISLIWFLFSIGIQVKALPKIPSGVLPFALIAVVISIAETSFQNFLPRDYTLTLPIISILFTRMLFSLKDDFNYLISHLTRQEQRITALIKEGFSNKEIAHELSISEHTVKNHIYNIFRKMGVQNRVMLCNILDTNTI